jgi:hypothetical protein
VQHGQFRIVKILDQQCLIVDRDQALVFLVQAQAGHAELCRQVLQRPVDPSHHVSHVAPRSGRHLDPRD